MMVVMFQRSRRGPVGSFILLGSVLLVLGLPIGASIGMLSSFTVDFTSENKEAPRATWSEDLVQAPTGLKLKNPATRSDDSWIVTEPEGMGPSWRTLRGVGFRLVVEGVPTPQMSADGTSLSVPNSGQAFVRFGPDCKHWSSWQAMTVENKVHQEKGALFTGSVGVTTTDGAAYWKLLSEYGSLDVPWKSDEEAAVKWILEKDPKFFEKHLPFVGWVQFRYEPPTSGEVSVEKIHVFYSWGVSGLHVPPRDPEVNKNRDGPWRFKAP